jgi:outer membrane biosynthesis protein TonB
MAALFAAAASMASTSAGAQPAPAAASAPAAELTPKERAQRDADKFFKWILIHSDKPRKAGVNRTDDKREERPAVAAGVKPAAPIAAAAASPVPVVSAPPPAGVAPVAETQTAAAPLAAVETRMTATAPALPIVLGADTADEVLTPLSRTGPKFPPSVLRSLSKGNVKVRFTVLPDGSVAEPAVVTSSDSRRCAGRNSAPWTSCSTSSELTTRAAAVLLYGSGAAQTGVSASDCTEWGMPLYAYTQSATRSAGIAAAMPLP